jgi:hypothetical protein
MTNLIITVLLRLCAYGTNKHVQHKCQKQVGVHFYQILQKIKGYYDEDNNLQSTEIAVDASNPYYNMARLTPFLTSFGRAFMVG